MESFQSWSILYFSYISESASVVEMSFSLALRDNWSQFLFAYVSCDNGWSFEFTSDATNTLISYKKFKTFHWRTISFYIFTFASTSTNCLILLFLWYHADKTVDLITNLHVQTHRGVRYSVVFHRMLHVVSWILQRCRFQFVNSLRGIFDCIAGSMSEVSALAR